MNNQNILISAYVCYVIIQMYIVKNYILDWHDLIEGKNIDQMKYNLAHKPELAQAFTKEIVSRMKMLENMDYADWINYNNKHAIVTHVARGDGKDYSAFHIFDVETFTQVGEYRGQINTKDYGHLLVSIATEYNNALLAVENQSVGWSTVQTILDRGYQNFYYSPKGGVNNTDSFFDPYMDVSKMTPGFTMSSTTRPIAIGKFQEAVMDKGVVLRSNR